MEKKIIDFLVQELLIHRDEEGNELDIYRADDFRSCGILTNEEGFMLTLNDGSEYQLFIVRNR